MAEVVWHETKVSREMRNKLLGFKNRVVWFTGLSGSGKSTIAAELEKALHDRGILTFMLDGDNIRHGLNSDLGFSEKDRRENIRRVAEVAKLFYEAGVYVLVSFISPFRNEREFARELIGKDFVEVFVSCPIEECIRRDAKGMYKKVMKGLIKNFTGIDSPYEKPENPDIVIDTGKKGVQECVEQLLGFLFP